MAQGLIKSDRSRDGLAAVLMSNVGDLEDAMYSMQDGLQATLDGIDTMIDGAQATNDETNAMLADIEAILQSVNISRESRLNRPNLLRQNYSAGTQAVATGTVIKDVHEIAAEDATAAANPITYTITDNEITSSWVLHAKYSSNYEAVSTGLISATFAAGVATITVAAREAHNGAVNITVYICATEDAVLPYGEPSRHYASSAPWINSSRNGEYRGDDRGDGIAETIVTLAAADQITEADGEEYTTAIQYAITANNAWGNADWLIYKYGQVIDREYTAGDPEPPFYGDIEELVPGKTYTLSCWARIISGEKAWVSFGYGGKNGNAPYSTTEYSGFNGIRSEPVEVTGGTWQRISWTFVFAPTGERATYTTASGTTTRSLNWTKRVMFGVHRKYTATLQLCGFRLVEGGLYLPTKYDEIKAQVDALGDGVASTAEAGAVITEYGVSAS